MIRNERLIAFLDALESAVATAPARPGLGSGARILADEIFYALADPDVSVSPGDIMPARIPACEAFEPAVANASRAAEPVTRLVKTFTALEPLLKWQRRAGSNQDGEAFHEGHANTYFVGPDGLEQRRDVIIGASLLAPKVLYPTHRHPPPELYVALSEGEWFNESDGWYSPGTGGLVHHTPGIAHAMRAGPQPLLAVWCLWTS